MYSFYLSTFIVDQTTIFWTRPKYFGPFERLLCTIGIEKKMLPQSSKYWSKIILGRSKFWLVQIIFDKGQKK